jgi:hypothetical protein
MRTFNYSELDCVDNDVAARDQFARLLGRDLGCSDVANLGGCDAVGSVSDLTDIIVRSAFDSTLLLSHMSVIAPSLAISAQSLASQHLYLILHRQPVLSTTPFRPPQPQQ